MNLKRKMTVLMKTTNGPPMPVTTTTLTVKISIFINGGE